MKVWRKINVIVQVSILVIGLISLVLGPMAALLLLLFFGAWQVVAAIVFAITLKHLPTKYKKYLTIYFILVAVVFLLINSRQFGLLPFRDFIIIIWGAISVFLGISHLVLSIKLLKSPIQSRPDIEDDILDLFDPEN